MKRISYRIPDEFHAEAKKGMKEIIAWLNREVDFERHDQQIIGMLGSNFNIYVTAQEELREDGIIVKEYNAEGKLKSIKSHPCVKISRDAEIQIFKLLQELGTTPRKRKKAILPKKTTESPIEKFISQNREVR